MRHRAISRNEILTARFNGKKPAIEDKKTGKAIQALDVSTLNPVNCHMILRDDMTIFDGYCTSPYNRRVHDGDVRLGL
jgi:hypothetical protein